MIVPAGRGRVKRGHSTAAPQHCVLRVGAVEQEIQRVQLPAVDEHFVVQVVARGAARGAGEPDDLATAHSLAGSHAEAVEMRVARGDAEAVTDYDHVAVRP